MVLNSLFPVFALILSGSLLKRYGMTNDAFLQTADKLTYYIFFPLLLFWKIGEADVNQLLRNNLGIAVVCALTVIYLLSLGFILLSRMKRNYVGSFSQSCYRFNTYIGMAIILSTLASLFTLSVLA